MLIPPAMDSSVVVVSATCVAASTPVAVAGLRAYRSFGGLRSVECPDSATEAVVRIRAARAMATALAGHTELRLKSCSRWPEKAGCDQACVSQLASSGSCRTRSMPARPWTSAKNTPARSAPDEFIGIAKLR